jgi:CheY-like chemotaxis protein
MALRVLLADESVTIKKVIQLALQDFAVEVKAVPVGLDVMNVAKSFTPDLVFADILLQKKSGYEVCAELKKDKVTAAIPVVLMWSSFMELDAQQFNSSGADGKLEKPFEVEQLRKLVLELVPRTRSQRLAHFLEFPAGGKKVAPSDSASASGSAAQTPHTPPASESPKAAPKPSTKASGPASGPSSGPATSKATPERPLGALPPLDLAADSTPADPSAEESQAPANPSPGSTWNMDSFDDAELPTPGMDDDAEDESFQPMRLPDVEATRTQAPTPPPSQKLSALDEDDADDDADQWQTASKYQLKPLDLEASINASLEAAAEEVTDELNQADLHSRTNDASQTLSSAQSKVMRTDTKISTQPTDLEFAPPASHAPSPSSHDPQSGDTKFHNIEFNSQPPDEIESPQTYDGTSNLAPPTIFDDENQHDATEAVASKTESTFRILPADSPVRGASELDLSTDLPLEIDEISLHSFKEPEVLALGSGQMEPLELEIDDLTAPTPKLSPLVQEVLRDPFVDKMRAQAEAEATNSMREIEGLDQDRLEAIVRRQMEPILKQVIERLVAERVPEIAERLVRQELQRLVEDQA